MSAIMPPISSTVSTIAGRFERRAAVASTTTLVVLFTAISFAISVLVNSVQHIVNPDGVLYVSAARLFFAGKFAEALAMYPWPGYEIVIAAVSFVTRGDALMAAACISIAADTVTTLVLLLALRQITADRAVLISGAVLILANPQWNLLRGSVVREHLFLMFLMIGFYFQVRDLVKARAVNKLAFAATGLLAAIFRLEALAFFTLVPLLRFAVESRRTHLRYWTSALACVAIAAAPMVFAYWHGGTVTQVVNAVVLRVDSLHRNVLLPEEASKQWIAYGSIVFGILFFGLLKSVGPANVALVGYFIRYCLSSVPRRVSDLVFFYFLAGIIVLVFQIFFSLIFDARHGLSISLVLTVPAAFGLAALCRRYRESGPRSLPAMTFSVFVAVAVIYGFAAGIKIHDGKAYVRSAASWLAANVPKSARVLSNNDTILFYAGLPTGLDNDFGAEVRDRRSLLGVRNWRAFDFVVLDLTESRLRFSHEVGHEIGAPPLVQFENGRGDRIVVFRSRL